MVVTHDIIACHQTKTFFQHGFNIQRLDFKEPGICA